MVLWGVLLAISCGEDRTYEYEEKTQHNQWIRTMMMDEYLWAEDIAEYEPAWKSYFAKPSEFVSQLAGKSGHSDKWSYVEIDTLNADTHERGYFNHVESYGMDFLLMTDPTGQTTKQMLRVVTVYQGGPADRAGLLRGDFICTFNGNKLSSNNVSKLQKGVARTLEVRHLALNEEVGFYWEDTVTVSLSASEYVEDVAYPVSTIVQADEKKVGYLMCTRLTAGPVEAAAASKSSSYRNALDGIMAEMKSAGVTEMVLDLRLCNFGTLDMAQRLASYVVCPEALNGTFAKTFWNETYSANNQTIPYDTSVSNLGLSRVYILTSSYTQGAAEWLIHALQHSMGEDNVILLGTATKGQNVMTQEVGSKFYVRLYPVVAYVADGAGDYNYGSIQPTLEIDEFSFLSLDEYGSPDEALFNTALQHILGLIVVDDSESEEESGQNDS